MNFIPHIHDLFGSLANVGAVIHFTGEGAREVQRCDSLAMSFRQVSSSTEGAAF